MIDNFIVQIDEIIPCTLSKLVHYVEILLLVLFFYLYGKKFLKNEQLLLKLTDIILLIKSNTNFGYASFPCCFSLDKIP